MKPKDLKKIMNIRNMLSKKTFEKECVFIEYFISFSIDLLSSFRKKNSSRTSKETPLDDKIALSELLFERNLHYLYSAYRLFLFSMDNPAYSLLRVVLESNLTAFTLKKGKYIEYYKEEFELSTNLVDEINKIDFWKNKHTEVLSKLKKIKTLKNKSAPKISVLVSELYGKHEDQDTINLLYSLLCSYSHAELFGGAYNTKWDEQAQRILIQKIIMFLIFTLTCFLDLASSELKKEDRDKAEDLLRQSLTYTEGHYLPVPDGIKNYFDLER